MFKIYKKKQGLYVRWGTFIGSSILFLFGAYRFYKTFPYAQTLPEKRPEFWRWAYKVLYSFNIPAVDINIVITPRLLISLVLGIILVYIIFYLCFKHQKVCEFLIDTESEMRKVSWPTVSEVWQSSIVVIIVIIILGIYLFTVDIILGKIFNAIFFPK